MLDIYKATKNLYGPDQFCIMLFAGEEPTERCQIIYNTIESYCSHPEEFKVLPASIQAIIVDLFMNIIRYKNFLEGVSKDLLLKRRRRNYDRLTETMETPNLFYQIGCQEFEEEFVERKLVLPLLEATPCLENLRDHLKAEIRQMLPPKKKITIPIFMNVLNRPNRRANGPPVTPEDLVVERFARKVPLTNYLKPLTDRKLELLRAANRSQAMKLLNDANKHAPTCLQRVKRPIKTTEKEKPEAIFVKKTKVPTFKPVEVKQTAASILRECARVISDEEKEIRKLKKLAEGGHDPSSISRLEEEQRKREREKELSKIQEKHLLALISREGAFIAKQSLLDDVKQHAESVRKEKQELYEKLEKWREQHNKEMAEIVERCREIEQGSRDAFNAMVDEKRQKAAEVSQESRQLKAQMMKQREAETRRKIKLIQEIKTIQSLRSLPCKEFDPTESSGLGLLCEMSLAELKERLFWMKMKLNEEIENRKVIVHRERERQKNMIRDTQRALENYKANKRAVTSSKSQRPSTSTASSPEVDALRQQLEERRALRLQKETALRSK
ncbi:hypothetical protein WN55_03167 [Dufourea novaeangliae]|uniref:Uncharacterized protein n=1 Tax=Dufourea novaeangliae TaxID=178035 RepID=A0A154PJP4_DUFNO|nr:hypothetical protein WN55_03167 [Dufourea novaeangliae]